MTGTISPERINKLRTVWKKARNYYATFFVELNGVRKELGDDALAAWCFDELQIGVTALQNATHFLGKIDGGLMRDELKRAKKAETMAKAGEKLRAEHARHHDNETDNATK